VVTLAGDGVTVTVATGAGGTLTVMLAVPLFPSLVAVIVALPAATPLTRPLDETVAIDALELDHAICRPERTLPVASVSIAPNCTVFPVSTLALDG
jgi:hypothetical protein